MFSRDELTWIECGLETELADRQEWRREKAEIGLDHTQDDKDCSILEVLIQKAQALKSRQSILTPVAGDGATRCPKCGGWLGNDGICLMCAGLGFPPRA